MAPLPLERALGIRAVESEDAPWRQSPDGEDEGAQIDLVLDRADRSVTLCEMKFVDHDFVKDPYPAWLWARRGRPLIEIGRGGRLSTRGRFPPSPLRVLRSTKIYRESLQSRTPAMGSSGQVSGRCHQLSTKGARTRTFIPRPAGPRVYITSHAGRDSMRRKIYSR